MKCFDEGEFGVVGIAPLVELNHCIIFIGGEYERRVSVAPPAHEHWHGLNRYPLLHRNSE